MSSLRSISYLLLGSSKIQVRIDGEIYHFEGQLSDIDNVKKMIKEAQEDQSKVEALEDFMTGRPRSFFGGFTITHDGVMYFRDFIEPVADALAEKVKKCKEDNDTITLKALENFQARLVLNRNPQARQDLYKFLEKNDMVITPKGYFVSYKAVKQGKARKMPIPVEDFLKGNSFRVDTDYLVEINNELFETYGFGAIKFKGNKKWIPLLENRKDVDDYKIVGRLDALYEELEGKTSGVFLDKHTGTIRQSVGDLIQMPRAECDDDPRASCSYGLHVGNPEYVNNFAYGDDAILIALVSPTDVIAVPYEDARKMRVCQYFITAFSKLDENGRIVPVESGLYEDDYEEKEVETVMAELENGNYDRYILPSEDNVDIEAVRKLIQKRLYTAGNETSI